MNGATARYPASREILEQRPERRSVVWKAMEAEDERPVPRLQVVQPDVAEIGDTRGQRHGPRSVSPSGRCGTGRTDR